jgi:hypothetical protein
MPDDPENHHEPASGDAPAEASNELEQPNQAAPTTSALVVPTEAFAEMFRDWAFRRQPGRTVVFPHAFVLDEKDLRHLHGRITKRLEEACMTTPAVQITVGYADLASETFTDWDACFEEAVETSDAERLEASWEGVEASGGIYQVRIRCVTERPLVTARSQGPVPEEARIEAHATGPTRGWINSVLGHITPVLKESRISRLYRPLELFRSITLREIGSWVVGAVAWYASFQLLQALVSEPDNESKLHRILDHHALSERFAAFVEQFYGPQQSFVAGLVVFMLPWGLFFAGLLVGRQLLGYVVPRSAINIGMATKRYKEYMNVFRFIVFTIFVGTILAILANLLSSLL